MPSGLSQYIPETAYQFNKALASRVCFYHISIITWNFIYNCAIIFGLSRLYDWIASKTRYYSHVIIAILWLGIGNIGYWMIQKSINDPLNVLNLDILFYSFFNPIDIMCICLVLLSFHRFKLKELMFVAILFTLNLPIALIVSPFLAKVMNSWKELVVVNRKVLLLNMAKRVNYTGMMLVDDSGRTLSGSYAGTWISSMIILSKEYIKVADIEHVMSTFAHELGHWYYNDNLITSILDIIMKLLILITIYAIISKIHNYSANYHNSNDSGNNNDNEKKENEEERNNNELSKTLSLFIYLIIAMDCVAFFTFHPLSLYISRIIESRADEFIRLSFGASLFKIHGKALLQPFNRGIYFQDILFNIFYGTHPRLVDRIKIAHDA